MSSRLKKRLKGQEKFLMSDLNENFYKQYKTSQLKTLNSRSIFLSLPVRFDLLVILVDSKKRLPLYRTGLSEYVRSGDLCPLVPDVH